MKARALAPALLALSASGAAAAADPEDMRIWMEVDPPAVRPGEEFTLTIRSDVPWDVGVHVPRRFDSIGPFPIVDGFQAEPVAPGERRLSEARYRLQAPARTGSLEVPPMKAYAQLVRSRPPGDCRPLLGVRPDERTSVEAFFDGCFQSERVRGFGMEVGERTTLEADPLVVVVYEHVPPDADTLDPRGVAGPVGLPDARGGGAWRWAAAAAAAAAALALLLARRRGRAGAPAPAEEAADAPPAGPQALETFRGIAENLGRYAGSFRPVHEEIARTLRAYIDRRLAFPAPLRTTEETLAGLAAAAARGRDLPGDLRASAAAVLDACDGVKFAGREATRGETARVLAEAQRFVVRSLEPAA